VQIVGAQRALSRAMSKRDKQSSKAKKLDVRKQTLRKLVLGKDELAKVAGGGVDPVSRGRGTVDANN
jgi:hypothetical protein